MGYKMAGDSRMMLALVPACVVFVAFSPMTFAQESAGSREVLLDNESVQVVRLVYPVGTESGMHTHEYPNRAAYFVQGGRVELVAEGPDGARQVLEVPDGEVLFLPASTHNVRNIGVTEVLIIETEIK